MKLHFSFTFELHKNYTPITHFILFEEKQKEIIIVKRNNACPTTFVNTYFIMYVLKHHFIQVFYLFNSYHA